MTRDVNNERQSSDTKKLDTDVSTVTSGVTSYGVAHDPGPTKEE